MEALRLFLEVVNGLWLLVLSVAVFQMWERSGMDHKQDEAEEDWQPVELSDSREFEMQEQEKRKKWYSN